MTGIILETVKRKLDYMNKSKKLDLLNGILNRLGEEKYRPHHGDAIVNPYSEFKTVAEKRAAYNSALDNNARVLVGFDEFVPLGLSGTAFNDVEYVAGLWRKQSVFSHNTIRVQDKEFVLLDKLNRQEHTGFDFYNAASVCWDGMGRTCDFKPSYVLATRDTIRGRFYAYGCSVLDGTSGAISRSRAHLTCKLFDAFQDVFENAARITTGTSMSAPEYKSGKWVDKYNISYETIYIQDKKDKRLDKEFVLLNKLNRQEHTGFEFYTADTVNWLENKSTDKITPSYIVAKRETNRGTFYAYGCLLTEGTTNAIARARAHLTCKLFDVFQDVFESAMQK